MGKSNAIPNNMPAINPVLITAIPAATMPMPQNTLLKVCYIHNLR